ncbi:MAG: HEPN domain-containing protein [Solirubrobacterales bacterium]
MTPSEDFARLLLSKARGDLAAASALAEDAAMPDDIVGFHCQQAVEKSLKSVLAQHDVDFPHTHDLAELAALIGEAGIESPLSADDAGYLKPWAVELRYDAPTDKRLDRQRVLGVASAVATWASGHVSEPG